jgi:hypothetical protein
MKRFWKIAGIATLVAILGLAAIGAVVLAQDGENGTGWPFDFAQRFKEAIADILNIDVETYEAAVEQARGQVLDEALEEGWLTEDQAERMQERLDEGFRAPGMDRGFLGPKMGFMGRDGQSFFGAAAEVFDMSVSDLMDELRDGKSIADLAAEKNVDTQDIVDTYLAQLEENLSQAVEDGKLTQTQADWMLEQAKETVPDQLDNTWEGRFPGGFRGGGRPGRMWDFPGQDEAPKTDTQSDA